MSPSKHYTKEDARRARAFKKAALPLIKYLAKNHNPHTKVIVTNIGAELLQAQMTTGDIFKYIED